MPNGIPRTGAMMRIGSPQTPLAQAIRTTKSLGGSIWVPGLDDWQNSDGTGAAAVGAGLGMLRDDAGLYPLTQATAANKPLLQRVPILGPELGQSGTGDNATGWITNSTLTVTGGAFVLTSTAASGTAYTRKAIATTAGVTYLMVVTQRRGTSVNSISTSFRDSSFRTIGSGLTNATTTNIVAQGVFVATTNTSYVSVAFSSAAVGETAYFDDISVREIVGYRNVYTANFDGLNDVMTSAAGWTLSDGLAISWCGAGNSAAVARKFRLRNADNTSAIHFFSNGTQLTASVAVAGVNSPNVGVTRALGDVGIYSATLTATTLAIRRNGVVVQSVAHGLTLNSASLYASLGGDVGSTFANCNTYAAAVTMGATGAQLLQIERGMASLAGVTL